MKRKSITVRRFAVAFFFALISPKLIRFKNTKDQTIGGKDGKACG
jgi:hypothetical protein